MADGRREEPASLRELAPAQQMPHTTFCTCYLLDWATILLPRRCEFRQISPIIVGCRERTEISIHTYKYKSPHFTLSEPNSFAVRLT